MIVTRVNNRKKMKKFINLPYQIYEDDPSWISPYMFDEKEILKKGSSVMKKDREFFLVLDGPQPVARLGVYTNKTSTKAIPCGYFTLFESYNDELAISMLFEMADSWFMMRKIESYSGPESPTNGQDYKGFLISNFDDYPSVNTTYNPPYYKELVKLKSLEKISSLACFHYNLKDDLPEQMEDLVECSKKRFGYRIKTPNLNNIEDFSKEIFFVIENSLHETNEGTRELTYENIKNYFLELRRYLDDKLFAIAYYEDQPIGFSAAIPNYNDIFASFKTRIPLPKRLKIFTFKKKIRSFRIFNVAVVKEFQKKGVSHALHLHIIKNAINKGYKEFEGGPINYDNTRSFQEASNVGGNPYKEYALYRREIH
ncbi:MAG: hypothetical protein R6U52_01880 [Kosmotogaceae bacterium]